jgi:HPt (histidine-containing phosphotransfer) domain-containing protein
MFFSQKNHYDFNYSSLVGIVASLPRYGASGTMDIFDPWKYSLSPAVMRGINMTGNTSIKKVENYLAEQFHLTEEQIESMLPGFVATLEAHMQNLEAALTEKSMITIGKSAHTLKGALLNLGLKECAKTALLIEEEAKAGDDSTNFKKLVDDLRISLAPIIT